MSSVKRSGTRRRLTSSGSKTAVGALLRKRAAMTVSPAAAGPGWRALSTHYSKLAEARSTRDDLNVVIAPGITAFTASERKGKKKPAPGYYMPATARIALDGNILPVPPEKLDMSDMEHFRALAALQGVFVHEVGHADHTDSMRAAHRSKFGQAVTLLEEIRMEARRIEDRPADAKWLRAASRRLILDEMDEDPKSKWAAAHTAVLTEGRVAAGSLNASDVEDVTEVLEEIFDADELDELRSIMLDATAIEDGDTDGMIAVAERLTLLFPPEDGDGDGDGLGGAGGKLAAAAAGAGAKAEEEAAEELADDEDGEELEEAAEEVAEDPEVEDDDDEPLDDDAEDASPSKVSHGRGRSGRAVRWSHAAPDPRERKERNKLSAILKKARWRDRDKTTISSITPPGRVKMREAMRGAADRSAGRPTTAKPFKRTKRRFVEQPKLKVAVLVDASGSMGRYSEDISSAMWIVSGAVHDIQGEMCGVAFGEEARLVVAPGKPSATVNVFSADAGFEAIGSAMTLADDTIRLGDPTGPRLVVIVSDGHWVDPRECTLGEQEIERLQATGAKIIQVGIGGEPLQHGPDVAAQIDNGLELADVVGAACLEALRAA